MNHHRHNQQGSVILYAMLTMSVMLAIGLTLNGLFLSKFKSAAQSRNSLVALYAADSAIEMCLYDARLNTTDTLTMANGAAFKVVNNIVGQPDITNTCNALGGDTFSFRAIGTFRGVQRSLEVSQ